MLMSPSIEKLAAALSKMQSEMVGAAKSASNPFFKSSYADLESCWEAIRKPLTLNQLAVSQGTMIKEDKTFVWTLLMHASGQYISSETQVYVQKMDMQSLGSAITYARRYALAAIVGLYQSDDDGNMAVNPVSSQQKTNERKISDKQVKLLMAKAIAMKWRDEDFKLILKKDFGVAKPEDLPASQMNKALDIFSVSPFE